MLVNSPVHSSTYSTPSSPQGSFGRIALRQHLDVVAIDHHCVAVDVHVAGEAAVRGVVPRQVRVGLGIAEIVDGDDLDLAVRLPS